VKLPTKFGQYGGFFVPETLVQGLMDLEHAFISITKNHKFREEYSNLLKKYAGRPTPLYLAKNLSKIVGCKVYLKREDLLHGGAHKINNALGQALVAQYMGKKRIIAETGAGQHGTAVAMVGALLNIPTEIYMGHVDISRQEQNVKRMKLCGAKVNAVKSGAGTLKDAVREALRDWETNIEDTFYILGSVTGPHPYPSMVKYFQSVIGEEARTQILDLEARLPDYVVACIGGGSNAIGIFSSFMDGAKLVGVEAGGNGVNHASTLSKGYPGVFQGSLSYVLQDSDGQIIEAHSVAPGLDYPGVGPEHSFLKDTGRAEYVSVSDAEAVKAFELLCLEEGIIPALESAHAIAYAMRMKPSEDQICIINLSGRGDKDLDQVAP